MTSPFDLQQTPETIRANIEARFATFTTDSAQIEKNRRDLVAARTRRHKLQLIREWRAKNIRCDRK